MDIILAVIGFFLLAQVIDGRIAFGLALAALLIWKAWRHKRDQTQLLALITADQERRREALRAGGLDLDRITLEIGRDAPWIDIVGQVFRVIDFDRAGTIVDPDGTVTPASAHRPYGYLLVESPILNDPVRLPIVHRDDFLLAASVFDEPTLVEAVRKEELLVTYVPKDKSPDALAGIHHALHFVMTPRGTMDQYYSIDGDRHMAEPAPEILFGEFVWEGEIQVGMNRDPSF